MRASEIAAFEPRAKSSGVKGMPNLCAISFTFSWLALDSADVLVYAIDSTGAFWFLCFANTLEITSWAEGVTLIALVCTGKVAKLTPISWLAASRISSLDAPALILAYKVASMFASISLKLIEAAASLAAASILA